MKKIFLIIILSLAVSVTVYSQSNMQRGFHVSLNIAPQVSPDFDVFFNLSLYYRFRSDIFFVYLFDNTKTDLGIFNNFTLRKNIVGVYIDSTPASFFNFYLSGGFINYHSAIKRGLYTFDKSYSINSRDDITNLSPKKSYGFIANIKPLFRVDIMKMLINREGLVLLASLDVRYAYMLDSDEYFYDYDTYMTRKKNDVSYSFNTMALFDYKPVSVGIEYTLSYVHFANALSQMLGGYLFYDKEFLRNFYLDVKLNIGQFISHPYMAGKLYFNAGTSITYKI